MDLKNYPHINYAIDFIMLSLVLTLENVVRKLLLIEFLFENKIIITSVINSLYEYSFKNSSRSIRFAAGKNWVISSAWTIKEFKLNKSSSSLFSRLMLHQIVTL